MQARFRINFDPATGRLTREIESLSSFGGSVSGTEHVHDIPLAIGEIRKPADWQRPDGVPWKYLLVESGDVRAMTQAERDARDVDDQAAAEEQSLADKAALKATITSALADPVTAVLVRAIRFLGAAHGYSEEQVNAKFVEWTDEEVNGQ
jgi:hypothetical protein